MSYTCTCRSTHSSIIQKVLKVVLLVLKRGLCERISLVSSLFVCFSVVGKAKTKQLMASGDSNLGLLMKFHHVVNKCCPMNAVI